MFVAQQAARSRVVRTTFVVACLIPCAVLVAWAGWRRTGAHRDQLVREWAGTLGMPLAVGRVKHLRPGALRLMDVALPDGRGGESVRVPWVDVESSATEVRIRLSELNGTPTAIAAAVRLARAWLDEPTRFDRNVVIDIGRFGFGAAETAGRAGMRIECVGAEAGRAIRLRAEPENGEWLVVQALAVAGVQGKRLSVRGQVATPVPLSAVAAALGWSAGAAGGTGLATLAGSIDAEVGGSGWDGSFSAVLADVDLAAVTTAIPWHATGMARVDIDECRMVAGRVDSVRGRVVTGAGGIAQEGLEALVTSLGCRAGPGWRPAPRGTHIRFERGAASVEIDERGMRITAANQSALLVGADGSLLEPPVAAVSLSSVARALSSTTAPAVPATPMSGWLLSFFPFPATATPTPQTGPPPGTFRSIPPEPRASAPGAVGAGEPAARR